MPGVPLAGLARSPWRNLSPSDRSLVTGLLPGSKHEEVCGRKGSCRLSFNCKRIPELVAAAVLKNTMREHGTDRLFEEIKSALKGDGVRCRGDLMGPHRPCCLS